MTLLRLRLTPLACALATAGSCAMAHDTWFAPRASSKPSQVALMLGSGNQFPLHDSGVGFEYLVRSGCHSDAQGQPIPLQRVDDAPTALWLRVPVRTDQALSCRAQLSPFEVQLAPDKSLADSVRTSEGVARMQTALVPTPQYALHCDLPNHGASATPRPTKR